MANITDLASLKANSEALEADLKAVFEKYGLTLTERRARIGGGKLEYKVELNCGVGEDSSEIEKAQYDAYARLLGLPADGFGSVYVLNGERFKITGVQPSKPKNCVKMIRVRDGRSFQCPAITIKTAKKVA